MTCLVDAAIFVNVYELILAGDEARTCFLQVAL